MIASLAAFAAVALLTPLATRLLGRRVFAVIASCRRRLRDAAHLAAGRARGRAGRRVRAVDPAARHRVLASGSTRSPCCSPSSSPASARSCCSTACATSPTTSPALGRFAALLLAFAGVMFGLVTADDVFLLFMFWEATSVLSYLLIGHYTGQQGEPRCRAAGAHRHDVRRARDARRPRHARRRRAAPPRSPSSSRTRSRAPPASGAIALVLVGAISKSALVPVPLLAARGDGRADPGAAPTCTPPPWSRPASTSSRGSRPATPTSTVWHPIVIDARRAAPCSSAAGAHCASTTSSCCSPTARSASSASSCWSSGSAPATPRSPASPCCSRTRCSRRRSSSSSASSTTRPARATGASSPGSAGGCP